MSVKGGWRGRFFKDFEVGDVYDKVRACRTSTRVLVIPGAILVVARRAFAPDKSPGCSCTKERLLLGWEATNLPRGNRILEQTRP